MVYNEQIEKLIDDLFENAKFLEDINPKLESLYEETKYPGVLYWMAYNYEEGMYGHYDIDQAFKYYMEAAEADYYGAKVWLSQYYIEDAIKDIMASQYWNEEAMKDIDTNEDCYNQAKNLITLALLDEDRRLYKEGKMMMQELSDEGYEPAMSYMDLLNNEDDEEVHYNKVEEELEDMFELFDEDFEDEDGEV